MMQMEAQMDMGNEAKTSGLAIAGLVCALILCIPALPLIGAILGVVAVMSIGSNPAKKGKGLALTAIVLGLVITVGQGVGGYYISKGVDAIGEYIAFTMSGPNDALTTGFNGDIAGFQTSFDGQGATADSSDAQAFLDELKNRYGGFMNASFDQQSQNPPQSNTGKPRVPFPFILQFDNESVSAEVELVFANPDTGEFLKKLGYIKVFDEEQGDLIFPPDQEP